MTPYRSVLNTGDRVASMILCTGKGLPSMRMVTFVPSMVSRTSPSWPSMFEGSRSIL